MHKIESREEEAIMIIERANYVETYTIGDAYREVMWLCVRNGYDTVVKKGSYEGQIRRQLPRVTIRMKEPSKRPLAPIMPPNVPSPTSDKDIENYFLRYLMSDEVAGNEQYTYGTHIKPQLSRAIELLAMAEGNTNQSCISVGDQNSILLSDPQCLRVVSFKVTHERRLVLSVFFRSWDLVSGLPQNLGGLQLLKEYVVASLPLELGIIDGDLIAYSDGLHIYEEYFGISDMLNVDKIKVGDGVWKDKEQFAEASFRK